MGALDILFGGGNNSQPPNANDHTINHSAALAPTKPGVVTPTNPGTWSSIHTIPTDPVDPRYFNEAEAKTYTELARARVAGAKYAEKVYAALAAIAVSDARVHTAHRGFQSVVAKSELQKIKANAGLAKALHGLRPGYEAAQLSLQGAEQRANTRLADLKERFQKAMED